MIWPRWYQLKIPDLHHAQLGNLFSISDAAFRLYLQSKFPCLAFACVKLCIVQIMHLLLFYCLLPIWELLKSTDQPKKKFFLTLLKIKGIKCFPTCTDWWHRPRLSAMTPATCRSNKLKTWLAQVLGLIIVFKSLSYDLKKWPIEWLSPYFDSLRIPNFKWFAASVPWKHYNWIFQKKILSRMSIKR